MRFRLTLTPYFLCLFLSVGAFVSCQKTLEEERAYAEDKNIEKYILSKNWKFTKVGGVYTVVRVPSYGYQVAQGDTIAFWYKGYTLDGKVFDTNIKSEARKAKLDTVIRSFDSLVTIAGKGNLIKGLDDGLLMIQNQELATILFSSSFGFNGNAIGPVKQWSSLAYDIKLVKVNGVGIQNEKAYIGSLNLQGNGFTLDTSGLYYKYLVSGTNPIPTIKDTIYGWYKGTLPNGTVLKDLGEGNQQIVLSNSEIPEGVRLGFMLTKSGGSADLVIPSFLGFGNKGIGVVGPYQTLLYQIRLDSIK